jgi:protein-tyrosine phosphatase
VPVNTVPEFVDIHCHVLPHIDDGASSWDESLAMARMAVDDGITTIIATPHQLGSYAQNDAVSIRQKVSQINALLQQQHIPLTVMPGADVRIEADMLERLKAGKVLTLGDQKKHVLLELPHEMYLPLEPVLEGLERLKMTGILSHPERNHGLLKNPDLLFGLVDAGCLMQVTAGSLTGTFGPQCQELATEMVARRQVHFVATDAHGSRARRPLMRRAFDLVAEIAGEELAIEVCCTNPALVAQGEEVEIPPQVRPKRSLISWLGWRKAG